MTPEQFDKWLRSWLKENSARFDKAFAFQ
jgi:hypothetical protein